MNVSLVISQISPGSMSLMSSPLRASMAALSETTMYPPSIFPRHRGLKPYMSRMANRRSLMSMVIENDPSSSPRRAPPSRP